MKNKAQNIITLIKEDHKPLKAGIKVLTSEKSSDAEKKKTLKRFLIDLKLHSKAEEMSLYANVMKLEDTRAEALEGFEEHNLADLLGTQLEKSGFESNWTEEIAAKAKVLAELVKHHAEEEEEEMLPDLKEALEREELMRLGALYTEKYKLLKRDLASGKKISGNKMPKAEKAPAVDETLSQVSH